MDTDRTLSRIAGLLLVLLLAGQAELQAQGWRRTFGLWAGGPYQSDGNYMACLNPQPDGSLVGVANYPDWNASYYFTFFGPARQFDFADNGNFYTLEGHQFHHFCRATATPVKDTMFVLEEKLPFDGGQRDVFLTQYALGQGSPFPAPAPEYYTLLWHQPLLSGSGVNTFAHALIQVQGGYLALLSQEQAPGSTSRNIVLLKASTDGEVLWANHLQSSNDEYGLQIQPAADGGFLILKAVRPVSNPDAYQAFLLKTDATGNAEWEVNLSGSASDEPTDMAFTADGGLIISGINHSDGQSVFLLKTDTEGVIAWRKDIQTPGWAYLNASVEADANGDILTASSYYDSTSLETDILLIKTTPDGQPIWEINLGKSGRDDIAYCLATTPEGYYYIGGYAAWNDNSPVALMIKTDVNGVIYSGILEGNVFHDLNMDCTALPDDMPLANWIVKAFKDSLHVFYGSTDSLGNYRIGCDSGDYVVTLFYPSDYWSACDNDVPLSIGYQDTAQVAFAAQTLVDCPYLVVGHTTSIINPCDTAYVFVSYCNLGPAIAEDAYVEVTLDSLFTFVDSPIPPIAAEGQTFTFPLGDIGIGQCGQFAFPVLVDCGAQPGYTLCSEAHIYPDSLCLPPGQDWQGAFITAAGGCDGDTIRFQLQNSGSQPMAEPLDYIVIEDAVLLMQGSFGLGAGESFEIPVVASGATYHLIAQQEPGAPGSSQPIAAVEGCVGSSGNSPSLGYINQFPHNDNDPFLSVFCWPVSPSFAPNNLQAFPTGFGDEHNIDAGTKLEYRISFQNTGADTITRLIVLDTLSPFLDPATVQPGASSHPYEFGIEGNGVLRFTFRGLKLPPTASGAEGPAGFVTFSVAQRPGNTPGTAIDNRASLQFGFRRPIATNTTRHTVHEPLIQVINDARGSQPEQAGLKAYPNPSAGAIYFELPEAAPEGAMFYLFDALGRQVMARPFAGKQFRFERAGLPPGIYRYLATDSGSGMYSGSVILR
ncbi:MAG: hypothetical protein KDC66_21150 [Phaeodactylibacter sp.]|nr:hypothetical protein [Phaeodactylibacter sp.]